MIGLSINSAGKVLSIAITDNDNTLYLYEAPERRDQGNKLITHISKGLESCGRKYSDIGFMGVVTGPGSFTGIRVGIAAVRGIAISLKVPVVGVSAFDLFAAPTAGKINMIAIESWRSELYFAFRNEQGKNVFEPINVLPEELKVYLQNNNIDARQLIVSGDAAENLKTVFSDSVFLINDNINAKTVAKLALEKINSVEAIIKPVPYYLRSADITLSNKVQRKIAD